MKVCVLNENLTKGMAIVNKVLDSTPTLPVLANVLLETDDARLKLSVTNLECSIVCWIGARVEQEGAITLPAKTMATLSKKSSPELVELTLNPLTLSVHSKVGTSKSNIKGIDAAEFPIVPVMPDDTEPDFVIPAAMMKKYIQRVFFAANKEDARPILTGIHFSGKKDTVTMAAADGYRLAVQTIKLTDTTFEREWEMTIPAKALKLVADIITKEDDEVGFYKVPDRGIVIFKIKSINISTQLLEGKYPDFGAIIPRSYTASIAAYATDMEHAVDRALVFAKDNAYSGKFIIHPAKEYGAAGEVTIIGKSNERGETEQNIDASVEMEAFAGPMDFSVNLRYALDIFSLMEKEQRFTLDLNGPQAPVVVRSMDWDGWITVLMPMSTGRDNAEEERRKYTERQAAQEATETTEGEAPADEQQISDEDIAQATHDGQVEAESS